MIQVYQESTINGNWSKLMSIHNYYEKLNAQTGIKAYLKKKLFGNLLHVLADQEIEQERKLVELSRKTAELSRKTVELSNRIGPWVNVPDVLEDDGIFSKKEYLKDYGEEYRKQSSDLFYFNLSNVFRGSEGEIRKTVEMFLPYVLASAQKNPFLPFVDFGCGRGEFLDVLRNQGVSCLGIDLNEESAKIAIENGHTVIIGNAIKLIEERKDSSISGLSMVMVSEHISFPMIFDSIFLFARKIAKGGPLLINTINPYCYERYGNFHLDPSHINYLPPEIYKLIMEMAGFRDIKILWSAPIRKLTVNDIHSQYENVTLVGYVG